MIDARRTWALLAALLTSGPVVAQEGLGLDLTEEGQKEEEKKEEKAPPPRRAESERKPVAPKPPPTDFDEGQLTQDDRVKSVQRKVYLKKNRFELSPAATFSVNDPYYSKFGLGVRGAYYLADTLAVAARFTYFQVLPTDEVRTAKRTFLSKIFFSVPIWAAMANIEWSPIYGKVTIFNSILHFDGYVLGGVGLVNTVMSGEPIDSTPGSPARGLSPAHDLGIGMRFVAKDYVAVSVALINTGYVEQPFGTTKAGTQNLMMLYAGASIFFPFSSTGRESE